VKRAAIVAAIAATTAAVSHARAENVAWMPGNGREVSRTSSASRDAPASALVFAPRVAAKGAVDFAFAKIDLGGLALRPGADGFFELEHADTGVGGSLPVPGQGRGPMLWRGHYQLSLALSAERLARAWLGARGAIEIAAAAGHESDHITGASFDDAPKRGDILYGGGGDFLVYDFAMRAPLGARVDLWSRLANRAYVRGPILHAPGIDAGVRWHALPHLEPLVSAFGEALLVDHNANGANDGWFVALLAGAALAGKLGELLPYTAVDAGNGKGLLINRREVRWSIGVRYAPF
jgi:hypothetical protein